MASSIGSSAMPSLTSQQTATAAQTQVGMVPDLGAGAGANNAAAGAASMPALTGGQAAATPGAAAQTPGAATTPSAGTPAGATPVIPAGLPDISGLAAKARWAGPVMAVAGTGAALWAFSKGQDGSKFAKFAGISAGLSGLALTGIGFQAHGAAKGRDAGIKEFSASAQAELAPVFEQYNAKIKADEALIQQLQAAGAGTGGAATDGAGTGGATPGADSPAPGAGAGDASSAPATTAPAVAAGQWTPAAVIGQAVELGAANTPGGFAVAEQGAFALTSSIGEAGGYATVDEANTAAQGQMSTQIVGTKLHRWVVLEHAGRFYAFDGQLDEAKSAPHLPDANGTVAAWNALRFSDASNDTGWKAYSWTKAGGSQFAAFTDGQGATPATSTEAAPAGTTPATTTPVTTTPATTAPATTSPTTAITGQVPTTTTGGGATSTPAAWKPASIVGSGFNVSSASGDGANAPGGFLQLQKVLPLAEMGLSSPAEAAEVARKYRAGGLGATPYTRYVTVKGADDKWYAYEGSMVSRPTTEIADGASPMHVFGAGFAEYFDGGSWQVRRDS